MANQLDIGVEYYLSEDQALTVSTFFKDLESHIGSSTDKLTLNGVTYDFTGPVNGDGGQIKGFEMMYQQAFKTCRRRSMVWVSTLTIPTPTATSMSLCQKTPAAAGWSVQRRRQPDSVVLQSRFRRQSVLQLPQRFYPRRQLTPSEINSIDAETTLDASVSYEVNSQLKLMLQGQNLTNEASTSYFDNDPSRIGSLPRLGPPFPDWFLVLDVSQQATKPATTNG